MALVMRGVTALMLASWSLMSVMGQDNVALESGQYPRYAPHSSCHTEYDHVSVVKQGM